MGRNAVGILDCLDWDCPFRIRNELPFGSVSPPVSAHHPAPSTYHCHHQLRLERLQQLVVAVSVLGVPLPKAEAPLKSNWFGFL